MACKLEKHIRQVNEPNAVKHLPRNIATILLVGYLQTTSTAHPGHGHDGPAHYVTEPQHAVVLLIAAIALGVAIVVLGRMVRRGTTTSRSA